VCVAPSKRPRASLSRGYSPRPYTFPLFLQPWEYSGDSDPLRFPSRGTRLQGQPCKDDCDVAIQCLFLYLACSVLRHQRHSAPSGLASEDDCNMTIQRPFLHLARSVLRHWRPRVRPPHPSALGLLSQEGTRPGHTFPLFLQPWEYSGDSDPLRFPVKRYSPPRTTCKDDCDVAIQCLFLYLACSVLRHQRHSAPSGLRGYSPRPYFSPFLKPWSTQVILTLCISPSRGTHLQGRPARTTVTRPSNAFSYI